MSTSKYCNDPDNCTYSDCPTAFCDRNAAQHHESPAMMTHDEMMGVIATEAHEACCNPARPRRRFRVSLEKLLPDPNIRNPFLAFRTAESFEHAQCKVLVRTWEFDAVDEQEVRMLLEEAKRNGEPQVMGMKIRSIEALL